MLCKLNLPKPFENTNLFPFGVVILFGVLIVFSSKLDAWEKKFYNPQPNEGDIVLPMPCNGEMVFRKISIPVSKPVDDYPIKLGGSDEKRDYIEFTRSDYIAGNFIDKSGNSYYLLGKYEISRLQYKAVMGEQCSEVTIEQLLPQGQVNWFEAIDFTNRYNLWLLKHAIDKLPKKDGKNGYVRLPTETEWEYAARGGIAVSPPSFQDKVYPMKDDIKRYVWLSGDQSAGGESQGIGQLKPNPLNLYDMLGNINEIVLEPFRLNKLDRLHGQTGSFVVKGGDYLTPEADIRSASRKEVAYYSKENLKKSKTIGFRVAFSVATLTSRKRLKGYQRDWLKLGKNIPTTNLKTNFSDKALENPIDELTTIANAVKDDNMKKRLKNLLGVFRNSLEVQAEQRARAAKSALRLGSFLCRNLSEDSSILKRIRDRYETKCQQQNIESNYCKNLLKNIQRGELPLQKNLTYYADTITQTAADYSASTLNNQKDILNRILKGRKLDAIIPFLETYRMHLDKFSANGRIIKSEWLQNCIKT